MSEDTPEHEIDLIDFHIKSPVLPRATLNFEILPETSDNLIDSELPVLEKKLQATDSYSSKPSNHKATVDIEDILIALDDEHDATKDTNNTVDNNVELLDILKNLDDVLNACLIIDSDEKCDNCSTECEDSFNVNYNSDDAETDLEYSSRNHSPTYDITDSPEYKDGDIRRKLRQYEENYNRFLSSGYVNRGYVKTEPNESLRRPLSACDLHSLSEVIDCQRHATVGCVKKKRSALYKNNDEYFDYKYNVRRPTRSTVNSDDEIDWSWLEDVARDINSCDPVSSSPNSLEDSSRTPESENPQGASAVVAMRLRDSMRRLDPLLIPNLENLPNEELSHETESTTPAVNFQLSVQERPNLQAASATNSSRANNNRASRSRSCESRSAERRPRSSFSSTRSRRPRSLSSSLSSISSSAESSPSFNPSASQTENPPPTNTTTPSSPRRIPERNRQDDTPDVDSPLGNWPHGFSSMMACLSCTLGLFNISRFAILSIHFGGNFIIQFVFLTFVFGLPFLTLQMCLGQKLGAGVVDMWRISPLFQGVGISLLISQVFTGLYSVIGVSWLFVYFRDSFITKIDNYRWSEPYSYYRKEIQVRVNGTYKLSETVPDYFNGVVLQRHHLTDNTYGTIKFQLAFNLAVVWMIVFVSLSKGLRSYGKVIYAFILLPVIGMFILCAKFLGHLPPEYIKNMFPETNWSDFFLNAKSWIAAAQETFLTWGLLGAAVMQIASHNKKHKHSLHRDSSLAAITTLTVLLLAAFLANSCVHILKYNGYSYLPSSFEQMSSYAFLRPAKDPLPPSLANTPIRHMIHNSFIIGDRIIKPNIDSTVESGYQVLRFATELVPATFAVLGTDQVSPFWAVLFYFTLIMFGLAQQLAIWHCVITGIIAIRTKLLKYWETTITFFSCACGFMMGLPMATELGIYVVYFFDYTIGGTWWLIIVFLFEIIAVFMVRGRPYSGDKVVMALFNRTHHPYVMSWAPALLSFTWNVILPVGLMVLCICTFKNGYFREMFVWHHAPIAEYWPLWARQMGSLFQLLPILCIPLVALVQSYRYLNNGPNDILDRIQLLYRPPIGEHMDEIAVQEAVAAIRIEATANAIATEDPPPKYTPPPSYTTATGARLAKLFRQTLRRSIRRITNVLGESTRMASRQRTSISNNQSQSQYPPPEYNTVFVEMSTSSSNNPDPSNEIDGDSTRIQVSTLERLRNLQSSPQALTAAEVASILRNSLRRSTLRPRNRSIPNNFNGGNSLSAQNLVNSAAPIGETSLDNEPTIK